MNVVFYAVADARFFVGAVALVNSLRLTGHDAPIVIIDTGLEAEQVEFLSRVCVVKSFETEANQLAVFSKPSLWSLETDRTVVMIDTDVIITGSLASIIDKADAGSICGFADAYATRSFPEWEELLGLEAPLHPQTYLNGSFVALSMKRWRWLVKRWAESSARVQTQRAEREFLLHQDEVASDPVGFNEQDTWNALLQSEAPEDAVSVHPSELAPTWVDRRSVRVIDRTGLHVEAFGRRTLYLHCTGTPKPWQRFGWSRPRYKAFDDLLPRVLFADDVALRLEPSSLPLRTRGTVTGRLASSVTDVVASSAYGALQLIPGGLPARITHALRTRVSRG